MTAGGHRRFLESDVRAFFAARHAPERPHAEVRAEVWRRSALSVLRAAERDLGGSSSLAAPFAAARVLLSDSPGVRPGP